MNDPNFVFDLREKRSPTAATMDKVRVWMTAHLEDNEAESTTSPDTGTGSLRLSPQNLLGIEDLPPDEITAYLDLSDTYVEQNRRADKKSTVLRGRTIINLFFETSTRTSMSFELAGKRLGGDVLNMSVATSSVKKAKRLSIRQ